MYTCMFKLTFKARIMTIVAFVACVDQDQNVQKVAD